MSFEKNPSTSASIPGVGSLKVSAGDITLDSSWSPYGQAQITVPLTDAAIAEGIRPLSNPRCTITASDGDTFRTYNMVVRQRQVSYDRKTILLDLATDERLLQDYSPIAHDNNPRTREASLRNLVNYVLNKAIPGAALAAGAATANLTAQWDATNLFPNPNFERSLEGWSLGSNARDMAQSASHPTLEGAYSGRWYSVAAGWSYLDHAPISVTAGNIYTFSGHGAAHAASNVRMLVRMKNASGATVKDVLSATVATDWGTWTRFHVTTVIPAGVTQVTVHVGYQATAGGQYFFIDGFLMSEGPVLLPYFSGDTPSTGNYTYTWSGNPGASSSERKATPERLPELFRWKAGTSAWDFLLPLVGVAGLRLFCDEKRRWRLVDPATFEVPGRLSVRPGGTVKGDDTIDADDALGGFTGVVAYYRWRTPLGENREEIDAAGSAGRVKVLKFDTPYPGPGIAAAHLKKLAGAGRRQNVTVGTDFTATPGQEVSISLPGTKDQVGRVARVQWTLGDEALMAIESSGLIEATPGSWLQGFDDRTWATTPDSETWATQP